MLDKPHLSEENKRKEKLKSGTPLRSRVSMWKGRSKCIAGIKLYALEKQINFFLVTFHILWLLEKYSDNSINSDGSCNSFTLRSHGLKNFKRCIKWAQTVEVDSWITLFYNRLQN